MTALCTVLVLLLGSYGVGTGIIGGVDAPSLTVILWECGLLGIGCVFGWWACHLGQAHRGAVKSTHGRGGCDSALDV